MFKRCFLVALLCVSPAVDLHAQAPAALLEKSRQATTLEQPSSPSFHLRAEFQTFDYKGVPDGDGTLDEVFEHGGRWKRTIVYRGQQMVEVFPATGMTLVRSDPDFQRSLAEAGIVNMLLAPVPQADNLKYMTLTTTPLKIGSNSLTCVVASLPYKSESDSKATAANGAYCISPDNGLVRSVQAHNNRIAILNNFSRIGTVYFTKDIAISEMGKPRSNLHVLSLEPSPKIAPDEFTLPGGVAEHDGMPVIPGSVIYGRVLSKLDPVYPESARQRHVQGTVILHAIVGKKGSVDDLELVSAPDDALAASAMDAVRKWTFEPYLIDGKPAAVDTRIIVNYEFTNRP